MTRKLPSALATLTRVCLSAEVNIARSLSSDGCAS